MCNRAIGGPRALPGLPGMLGVAALLLLSSACGGDFDFDGTSFRCELQATCPEGYVCVDGRCVRVGTADAARPANDFDAASTGDPGVDALPDPDRIADASAFDARVDAAPPDAGPIIVTFGERIGADHAGVTTDTYLDIDYPSTNFGRSELIKVDANRLEVGVLRFDLSALPPSAKIVSATLYLHVAEPLDDGGLLARPLAVPWEELWADIDAATRSTLWPGRAATGASVRNETAFSAPSPILVGDLETTVDVTIVDNWVAAPATNHGLRLTSTAATQGVDFASSEAADQRLRPLLEITYFP